MPPSLPKKIKKWDFGRSLEMKTDLVGNWSELRVVPHQLPTFKLGPNFSGAVTSGHRWPCPKYLKIGNFKLGPKFLIILVIRSPKHLELGQRLQKPPFANLSNLGPNFLCATLPLPLMHWIGSTSGSGHRPSYDGCNLKLSEHSDETFEMIMDYQFHFAEQGEVFGEWKEKSWICTDKV